MTASVGEPVGVVMSWWSADCPEPKDARACANPDGCGERRIEGRSYCPACDARFYVKGGRLQKTGVDRMISVALRERPQAKSVKARNAETLRAVGEKRKMQASTQDDHTARLQAAE